MNKKHTTTRTTEKGERVKVYVDHSGQVFITVIDKDNFTIKADFVIDASKGEKVNVLH
jgi:hypothetical protein